MSCSPSLRTLYTATSILLLATVVNRADEPTGDLAKQLAQVKFDHYAPAPGYSEGPTWRKGVVFFCSGALLKVAAPGMTEPFLDLGPAGTVLLGNGHLLIADNKYKALVDLSPEGVAKIVVDRFETETLKSLNDLTVDARGNVYWSDPEGSSLDKPIGSVFRLRPDGRVDRLTAGLAFPNGLEVDPASKFLYVIESQSKKILRYELPADEELLGKPELFYDLGGSGGDGCAFDAEGNLWTTDFHRPETGTGRITVLSPTAQVLAYLDVPAKVVSNIAFGGPKNDEIFCTTGEPPGVFHAKVGVKGFAGHPGKPLPVVRTLNLVTRKPHADADAVRMIAKRAADAKLDNVHFEAATKEQLKSLSKNVTDPDLRQKTLECLPLWEPAARQFAHDQPLLAEIKRLNGKATVEVFAPDWLRSIAGDEHLAVFGRITEIDLNERTDGHKEPEKKDPKDRVTDDWLKLLAGQDRLTRLELSGTAVTSAGLQHLKDLKNLERLNVCLTAVDDRGFEHLAGLTKMRRMTVCASQITGSGFAHLGGMQQLESINLHSAPASDEGLAAIGKLTSLKRLEIVHTHVTDAGLKQLAGLTNLQQLHIHGPETTETALPFLSQFKELYEFDVYDKAASNQTVAQIIHLPKLRKLMLIQGVFDDDAVKQLSGMKTLEEVTLNSAQVTDASIDALSRLTRLRKLNLGGTRITAEGKQRLQAALPKTVIEP